MGKPRVMLRLWALLWIGLVLVHATDSDHAGFDGDYSELSDTEVRLGEADVQLLRHGAKPPLKKLKKRASAKKAKKQKKAAKKEMKKAAKKAKKQQKKAAKKSQEGNEEGSEEGKEEGQDEGKDDGRTR